MKKSVLKLMSMALVIVLMLSTMSITAFAAEADDVTPCAVCQHPDMMIKIEPHSSVYDDECHYLYSIKYYTCADCGYSYSTIVDDYLEVHQITTYVSDGKGGFVGTCPTCGYQRYK